MKFGEPIPSETAIGYLVLARVVAAAIVIAAIIVAPAAVDSWALLSGADVEAAVEDGEPVPSVGIDVLQTKAEAIEPLTMSY